MNNDKEILNIKRNINRKKKRCIDKIINLYENNFSIEEQLKILKKLLSITKNLNHFSIIEN